MFKIFKITSQASNALRGLSALKHYIYKLSTCLSETLYVLFPVFTIEKSMFVYVCHMVVKITTRSVADPETSERGVQET